MQKNPIAIIILAAGHGTRMNSTTPKVLHEIAGLSMLGHVIKTAEQLAPERLAVVIGSQAPEVGEVARSLNEEAEIFVQAPPQGTGDAVKQALPALADFSGTVLVLYADTPLIILDTLTHLLNKIDQGNSVSVLGFHPSTEHAYGRLIVDSKNRLQKIVEHKDATEQERTVSFCNSGVMAFESSFLMRAVPDLNNNNAKGEYYLTDLVSMATEQELSCTASVAAEDEVLGVDSRIDLSLAENIWQSRRRISAMEDGATLQDPSTVYFSHDTHLGKDVVVGQQVVFGLGVVIDDGVEIKPFSHLEGARLSTGVSAGPFVRLRPGAELGKDVKVGNFVEIKKAILGTGAKVSHLSYIGDAELGSHVNIGAGTITCNYDGFNKFKTIIQDGAFVGSNSSLVAPVTIEAGAYVGSGSVITKTVERDSLAVARGRQASIKTWAKRFRDKNKKK